MNKELMKGLLLSSSSKTGGSKEATNGSIQIMTFSGITDQSGMIGIGGESIKHGSFTVLVGGNIGTVATGSQRGVTIRRKTMLMMARFTPIRIGHLIRSPLTFRERCKSKGTTGANRMVYLGRLRVLLSSITSTPTVFTKPQQSTGRHRNP